MDKKSQTRLILGILLISIFSLSFVLSSGGETTTIIKEKEIITLVSQDETKDDNEEIINLNKPSVTGGAIGAYLLSGGQITLILVVLCGTFIIFMIVRNKTILGVKKK